MENIMTKGKSGSTLFLKPVTFLLSAADADQFPQTSLPEIAVIGRSNVGKSSLINAMFNRKTLARTSKTPGRTRQINFFEAGVKAGDGAFILCDLPGYGYARLSKTEHAKWDALMHSYFSHRTQLILSLILVDSRHGLKDSDMEMLAYLTTGNRDSAIVLTKTDKLKKEELDRIQESIKTCIAPMPHVSRTIIPTSASKKRGIDTLQAFIQDTLATP